MRTSARPRLPDGDCVFISDVRIVARANAFGIAADMTLLGLTPPTRPCAYCLLGFETLKDFEFRNREGANVGDDLGVDSMFERGLVPILSFRDASLKVPIARTSHDSYIWESVLLVDL